MKKVLDIAHTEEQDDVLMRTDKFVSMSLVYLYRKATEEIQHPEMIERKCMEVEGVLLSKGRSLYCMNFSETG